MTHKRYNKFKKEHCELGPQIGIYLGKDDNGDDIVQMHGSCAVSINEPEDLGELTMIHGTMPIEFETYQKLAGWIKQKQPGDDLHEFMMNLPWPFPKNTTPVREVSGWNAMELVQGPNRVSNFEQEYNCEFIMPEKRPEQSIPMINIWDIIDKAKEDPLLPGTDVPTIEKYDVPIAAKYWGIDLGPGRDDYSILSFSQQVLNDEEFNYKIGPPRFHDILEYVEEGNYWKKPLLTTEQQEKIYTIVHDHQQFMKNLRKYKKKIKSYYKTGTTIYEITPNKKHGFFYKLFHRKQEWN